MSVPETFYTIDILFTVFVFFVTLNGLRRGFSGELAGLLSFSILVGAVVIFYPSFIEVAGPSLEGMSPWLIQILIFLALLVAYLVVYGLLRLFIRQLLKGIVGTFFDKLFGGGIGLLHGVLTGIMLMASLSLIPHDGLYNALAKKSEVGEWVCNRFTPWIYPHLMELPVFDQEEN